MRFVPNKNQILARKAGEQSHQLASGLYRPDKTEDPITEGVVVETGEGVVFVAAGDSIVFDKYAGVEVKVQDEKFIVLAEEEILGKFTD